ncbi:MAG: c-type cytochrome [Phycisphaerae bacterium]
MDRRNRDCTKIARVGAVGACSLLLGLACATMVEDRGGPPSTNQEAGADVPELSGVSEMTDAAAIGARLFRDPQAISSDFQPDASCAQCHGDDGSGGRAPSVRGADADTLQSLAQGDGQHLALAGGRVGRVPEVKFPELTAEDFAALAAFLAGG